ncbi:MAG TPA: hypothetical protein VMR50_21940 [Myxococcota bacterium]|nr:hypothetical protein [Myxococcota bacterium]
MKDLTELGWLELAQAIALYVGRHDSSYPKRSVSRLETQYGSEKTEELLLLIKELESDFYESDAKVVAADLVEMGERASADFRRRRPLLPDIGVEALAWCYAYDFK